MLPYRPRSRFNPSTQRTQAVTRSSKTWLVSLFLTAAVVWLSIRWLDRPIALWVRDTFGAKHVPVAATDSPVLSISLLPACVFAFCGFVSLMKTRFSRVGTTITLCTFSALAAIAIKDQLKILFGRTWPDSWAPGILSFLHDGVYGFHYFHSGKSFESFPSGHAAVAASILSVPFIMFPRARLLCAICLIAVDIALVALNLHFFSDVIAGSFTGFSAGLFAITLWRATNPSPPRVVMEPGGEANAEID
jgi:membrane-associated phospholipid phosphatase